MGNDESLAGGRQKPEATPSEGVPAPPESGLVRSGSAAQEALPREGGRVARRSRSRSRARAERSRRRKWPYILLAVIIAVAVGVGGYLAYQGIAARKAASDNLDEAITLVERADSIVLEIDEVVRAEVDAELANRAAEALADVPDAVADLEEATSLIAEARPDLAKARIAEAEALEGSTEARLVMLGYAEVILDANVKAASAISPANEGWDQILAAEKIADEAVAQYNKLTTEAVKKSKELSTKATGQIESGKTKLQEAQDVFAEADFGPFIAYADAKLAVLKLSRQADDAFLAGKKEEANKISKQYNDAEKKLVEQAKQLPSSPNAVIAGAYESLAGSATVDYFEAREKATVADAELMKVSESEE